jgi:cytochrome c
MRISIATLSIGLLLLMVMCGSPIFADERLSVRAPRSRSDSASYLAWGKELFGIYCASCHGTDGTGNGPAVPSLKTAPPDLTEISKRHGGKFPRMQVVGFIDGDMPIVAHGSREMPVWGRAFRPKRRGFSSGSPEIYALTDYIESIQKKTAQELGTRKHQ